MADPLEVLLVDDEADVRTIVEIALTSDPDIHLTSFENGIEALTALSEHARRFDLALIDVNLPGMSGPELIGELRRLHALADLKVALFTAGLYDRAHSLAIEGVIDTIEKPFDVRQIRDRVRALAS